MIREKITTEHTPESWEREIHKYKEGKAVDIYARAGFPELRKKEEEFAEMIGVPDVALFNSGMAAIYTAVEAENLKPGDVVFCGKDVYGQTKKMYESLKKRGIEIELLDSGNMEEIEAMVKEKKPRLIILEDIANSSDMQVCDLKKLSEIAEKANSGYKSELSMDKLLEKYVSKRPELENFGEDEKVEIVKSIDEFRAGNNPFVFRNTAKIMEKAGLQRKEAIRELSRLVKYVLKNSRDKLSLIIDNTLASPQLYNPLKDLGDAEAVVVESGTKHYQEGGDKITLGIAYSVRKEKIDAIKDKRTELGSYLQPNDEKEIPEKITETMPDIMKRHAANALKLAELIDKTGKAEVSHPNLPEHKDNELARKIAPEGLVTLFYLTIADAPKFIKRVKEIGGDKIGIGVSFGHYKTWVFNIGDQVRIAAGSESEEEFQEVLNIFEKALI